MPCRIWDSSKTAKCPVSFETQCKTVTLLTLYTLPLRNSHTQSPHLIIPPPDIHTHSLSLSVSLCLTHSLTHSLTHKWDTQYSMKAVLGANHTLTSVTRTASDLKKHVQMISLVTSLSFDIKGVLLPTTTGKITWHASQLLKATSSITRQRREGGRVEGKRKHFPNFFFLWRTQWNRRERERVSFSFLSTGNLISFSCKQSHYHSKQDSHAR